MISRFRKINNQNINLLFFAFLVGLAVGLLGAIFRISINYIDEFRLNLFAEANASDYTSWLWPILFAVVGVSVSLFLVKRYAPESSGSGVQEIEGALDGIRPVRWKRVIPVKFIASLFSLGSGLLLGREGPTIQIGGNVGKMIKDIFKQSDEENNPLVSAGAAAGLASAFNAPFSGIIFVIEEMHGHFKFNFYSLAAIMIGSGTADFVVRALTSSKAVIQMTVFHHINVYYLWLFIVLGLVFSLVGIIYNKLIFVALNFFESIEKTPIIVIGILVGLILAIIGIFYPDMIGSGYGTISKALNNSFGLSFLLVLFLVRMFLSIFSYGIGVPGGIFAPMLTLGVVLGMLYGNIMQDFFPDAIVSPSMFAVAGMAAIFASTVRAPLTGLVLAIEMTSNFELILPLIITTVTASAITSLMGNKPIYTTLLKRTLEKEKIVFRQD
jgi:CIC family chloride channel protein